METFLKNLAATLNQSGLELLPDQRLVDLPNWDSLAVLTTASMLDREYGISISGPDIQSCETLQDLFTHVQEAEVSASDVPQGKQVENLISASLLQLRKDLGLPVLIEVDRDTAIYGRKSDLDSLSVVHLVVDIEARLYRTFGKTWVLADERALSQNHSPFRTIGSLGDFIVATTPGSS